MRLTKLIFFFAMVYWGIINCEYILQQAAVVYKHKHSAGLPLPEQYENAELAKLAEILESRYSATLIRKIDYKKHLQYAVDLGQKMVPAAIQGNDDTKDINEDIITPIDIKETIGDKDATELATTADCPSYEVEMKRYLRTQKYKKISEMFKPIMTKVAQVTGLNVTFRLLEQIRSTLIKKSLHKINWPAWAFLINNLDLYHAVCFSYTIPTDTKELARLSIGDLLKDILLNLELDELTDDHEMETLHLYRADAYTMVGILHSLGLYDYLCPEDFSAIFIEYFYGTLSREYYIKISYRNYTHTVEPQALTIPGQGQYCDYDDFKYMHKAILPKNRTGDCIVEPQEEMVEDGVTREKMISPMFAAFNSLLCPAVCLTGFIVVTILVMRFINQNMKANVKVLRRVEIIPMV